MNYVAIQPNGNFKANARSNKGFGGMDILDSTMKSSQDVSSQSKRARNTRPVNLRDNNTRKAKHMEITDSDDEMDLLSSGSTHSLSPEPPSRSTYHHAFPPEKESSLKNLKFKKNKPSGSDGAPTATSTTSKPPVRQSKPVARDADVTPKANRTRRDKPIPPKKKNPSPPAAVLSRKPSKARKNQIVSSEDDRSELEAVPKAKPLPKPRRRIPTKKIHPPSPETSDNSMLDKISRGPLTSNRKVPTPDDTPRKKKNKSQKPAAFPMSPSEGSSQPPQSGSSFPDMSPLASSKRKKKQPQPQPQNNLPVSPLRNGSVVEKPRSTSGAGGQFPMQKSDFETGFSPTRKRLSEGPNDRDAKRWKEEELEAILQRGKAACSDADDDDDGVILSSTIDPRTLCPYCDDALPKDPTPVLHRLLKLAETKSWGAPRPNNPMGRKAAIADFITVCHRHRFETELAPKAEIEGWPKTIDWNQVSKRVCKMKNVLQCILLDKKMDGPRSNCVFWQELVKQLERQGARTLGTVRGQFATFEKIQPGYYGEQGSVLIQRTLQELLPLTTIDAEITAPLNPRDFVERILVPEVAARLIMKDHDLSGESGMVEAVTILRASAQYGVSMFPEDGGEDDDERGDDEDVEMGVADRMLMDRVRRRREEIEVEEREASETSDWKAEGSDSNMTSKAKVRPKPIKPSNEDETRSCPTAKPPPFLDAAEAPERDKCRTNVGKASKKEDSGSDLEIVATSGGGNLDATPIAASRVAGKTRFKQDVWRKNMRDDLEISSDGSSSPSPVLKAKAKSKKDGQSRKDYRWLLSDSE